MRKLILSLGLLLACGTSDANELRVGTSVSGLDSEGLPDDVTSLVVSALWPGEEKTTTITPDSLMDGDGNGRPETVLGQSFLPPFGTPFEIRVVGNVGSRAAYRGSTGEIRLQAGERRVLNIALYEIGAAEFLSIGTTLPPRFLHTSTRLEDGRVLIAGGFDNLRTTTCPDVLVAIDGTVCYLATASDKAYIFNPPSGRFYPVEGDMLAARGGHTATLLPDGRVLVAGGAEEAVLAFANPEDSEGIPDIRLIPLDGDELAGLANFELFDATMLDPSDDPNRDGAPGRGIFTGPSTDPGVPGRLNHARFLHGAAVLGQDVVLAGGIGAGSPGTTFSIFDPRKPGGEGVRAEDGMLRVPRSMPTVFVFRGEVWVFGGAEASSNDQLAEIIGSASDTTTTAASFPSEAMAQLSLFRPQVTVSQDGNTAVVSGWYGPRCDGLATGDDRSVPTYEGLDPVRCGGPNGEPNRNVILGDADPVTFGAHSGRYQSFGTSVRLPDDSLLISGGLRSNNLQTRNEMLRYRFDGTYTSEFELRASRAFHTSTVVTELANHSMSDFNGYSLLTTGGVFNAVGTLQLTPSAAEMRTFE